MLIETQLLYASDQVVLAVMIFIIMFGMGASLTIEDFRTIGRHSRGVFIGFLSQFGFMPLLALGLSYVLQLSPSMAIALILIGCLPGGTTSNIFTYFSRGSVALSVAMTTASTLVAIVMMPLLLELYAAGFVLQISQSMQAEGAQSEFIIPTMDVIGSLVLVLVPVAMGMFLRKKSPPWAKTVEDTAGFLAIIVILYLLATALIRHNSLFLSTPWELYAATIAIGLLGISFGYLISRLFKLPPIFQRAISLETGIQNTPVVFAIILLSFTGPIQSQMLWLAILYSTFIVAISSFVTLFYRKIGKFDWEVYSNTIVHNRLFGENYKTRYPEGFLPKRIAGDPSQGTLSPPTNNKERGLH
ncbi:MAG: bile acid:sodium symporter [Balneolales bacterium]